MKTRINNILKSIEQFKPEVISTSAHNSCYIKFSDANKSCRILRISDHEGRGIKKGTWQFRVDVCSNLKDKNRLVFGKTSLEYMIRMLKK